MDKASFPPSATYLTSVRARERMCAIAAARAGAQAVTTVDLSAQAVATAWVNSRIRGVPVELIYCDFTTLVGKPRSMSSCQPLPGLERTSVSANQ
jgi:release factor glutamine methyltransferase